ncbi:ABC transporter ATP-binding protein [Liquorilactobacillus satsumensis]|uniref:ABC transporter ATP-binding protein n=1 Tax=Liquorilactobacillus satsumensis TaxID=259059 RepID=UPI001E41A2A8|nr:ABC transporter ATP-binding protein [Liquorilactobacillus satsumensis]MCC7666821.1 export ABC transporter ATP-binding protein [Liquorilactobacillus satsumensis]MCP9312020.1 ABC transporter ATP-binding protein [Liquorilactobacillus satsumensis]MCP9358365.1 ABC transporter ATP-binding protein [Liquorilactobacillus satsumensis]MCP9359154.1 ABC transporter ATP-binding protein [Liquorilactobacillus satsumensis]MCP9372330.1 ABC transporter ATP-binding protein [Liquorilactobacillus satsumensis]
MTKIVELKELTKKFPDGKIAVDNLSLTVEKGDIIGFLGPNGAGKSTTINMMMDLIGITSGTITLFGESARHKSNRIRSKIGMIPQEIAIYEDLTAFENVAFFGGLYGLRGKMLKAASLRALRYVALEKNAKEKAENFSGGMKRRLNIACALVHEPELIIMDEPTVGIDPQSRNFILGVIETLNKKGITIIYSTHYMEEVERISNKIAIIDHGKLIACGSEAELINLVTNTQNFSIEVLYPEKVELQKLRALNGVQQVQLEGQILHIIANAEKNPLDDVLKILIAAEVAVKAVDQDKINLETVFLMLTGRKLRDAK